MKKIKIFILSLCCVFGLNLIAFASNQNNYNQQQKNQKNILVFKREPYNFLDLMTYMYTDADNPNKVMYVNKEGKLACGYLELMLQALVELVELKVFFQQEQNDYFKNIQKQEKEKIIRMFPEDAEKVYQKEYMDLFNAISNIDYATIEYVLNSDCYKLINNDYKRDVLAKIRLKLSALLNAINDKIITWLEKTNDDEYKEIEMFFRKREGVCKSANLVLEYSKNLTKNVFKKGKNLYSGEKFIFDTKVENFMKQNIVNIDKSFDLSQSNVLFCSLSNILSGRLLDDRYVKKHK